MNYVDSCACVADCAPSFLTESGDIITETSGTVVIKRDYPQFRVGTLGSPMAENDTVLVIVDADAVEGFVEVHVDGLLEGQDFVDIDSYTAVYTAPDTWTITFLNPVRNQNVITIAYPVRLVISGTQVIVTAQELIYTAQTIDVETKFLKNQVGAIFTILAGTVNLVSFTMFCVATTGEMMVKTWRATAKNVGGVITINPYYDNDSPDEFGGALAVVVTGDNALQGIKITVTGILNKTINYRAIFTNSSSPL